MSIRPWPAEQSGAIEVQVGEDADGPIIETHPVVTQQDLIKMLVDAAIVLDRCGGSLGVVLERIPGPIPNQMVTRAAVCQWQERTNAKPQPEPSALERVELPSVQVHDPAPQPPTEREADEHGEGDGQVDPAELVALANGTTGPD